MTGEPPAVRASDAERDEAVARLREASVEGRLTLEELADRAERAQQARTRDDLVAVTADLGPGDTPAAATERHIAVVASTVREGRWRPAVRNRFVSVVGSIRLDLREAVLPGPELEIELSQFVGSAVVLVPKGVDVRVSGGGVLCKVRMSVGRPPPAGAPVVRVSVGGALGSVEIRTRPRAMERLRAAAGRSVRRRLGA